MSVVWQATDDVLGRAVAVNILAGEFTLDVARAAVLSEAQAVARLSHPNLCGVFDYGESLQADGHMVPYIVMELLSGLSLANRLRTGPLTPREALTIAAAGASGLAAAHALGVVHRDVKPANVILTPTGAKVIDFGIAATTGASDAEPDGSILATPAYVAPERLLGGTVLAPSDMFGWGVLLFRSLTGELPWPTWAPLEDRLSSAAPLPVLPGIPGTISDLYLSCLAEDPDDRPTAATAAAVLRVALAVRTPQPDDVAPKGELSDENTVSVSLRADADGDRRRRRRRKAVLAVALVMVLAATAFAFSNQTDKAQGEAVPSQTAAPDGEVLVGSATPGDPNASPTEAVPGREVPVPGVPVPAETVTVMEAGNPFVPAAQSFHTNGGSVVAVCDSYGPRVTSIVAEPGFYPNQVSLILAAMVFFTRPADGANPSITYRLTITCSSSGGEPSVTMTSYLGDHLVTPAANAATTTGAPTAT
jgi:hypothetical protein